MPESWSQPPEAVPRAKSPPEVRPTPKPGSVSLLALGSGWTYGARAGGERTCRRTSAQPARPVRLALEQHESVHLPLRPSVAPGSAHGCLNSDLVASDAVSQSHHVVYGALFTMFQPGREAVKRVLPQDRAQRGHELLRCGKMRTQTLERADRSGLGGNAVARGVHEPPGRLARLWSGGKIGAGHAPCGAPR
jgi:hypothetical protein